MDTFKDFFSDLKERISNPFISSFMIGWIIFNYPIIVTLIFYKQSEIKLDGYTSYLNMIQSYLNENSMFWYPLFVALIYTFLVPFFKSGIRIFNSWMLTSTDGIIYKMTKNKVVSVEIHTKVSSDLEEVKSRYVNLIANESNYKNEIDNLNSRIIELGNSHTSNISELNNQHDKQISELVLEHNSRMNDATEESMREISQLSTQLDRMRLDVMDKESMISNLSESLVQHQSTLSTLKNQNANHDAEYRKIEKYLLDSEAKVSALKRENASLVETNSNRLVELSKIRDEVIRYQVNTSKGMAINQNDYDDSYRKVMDTIDLIINTNK